MYDILSQWSRVVIYMTQFDNVYFQKMCKIKMSHDTSSNKYRYVLDMKKL